MYSLSIAPILSQGARALASGAAGTVGVLLSETLTYALTDGSRQPVWL